MAKSAVIFFPNHHLAYSPSTINLYSILSERFEVKIVAPYPAEFNNKELTGCNVEYFQDIKAGLYIKLIGLVLFIINRILDLFRKSPYKISYARQKDLFKYKKVIRDYGRKLSPDLVIAVDIVFLKIATDYFKSVHFLSLEISDELIPLLNSIKPQKVQSVIVQSQVRYNYLFRNYKPLYFEIQNSPMFSVDPGVIIKKKNTILYSGTASVQFGVFEFIEFIRFSAPEVTGVIKGNVSNEILASIKESYSDLLSSGLLKIDNSYTDQDKILSYMSEFEIGFCHYSIDKISDNKFNYLTAPSGKLFNYLAAGVPVIGSDIPGLSPVTEFNCGILIKNSTPQEMYRAYQAIRNDYEKFHANCKLASEKYNFRTMANNFAEYLSKF